MTEKQKKAMDVFAEKAKDKGVHLMICLVVTSIMLNSDDWESTLNDIISLIDDCKDAKEFEIRLLEKYPGQKVAPEE